jgi:hypothetical protein
VFAGLYEGSESASGSDAVDDGDSAMEDSPAGTGKQQQKSNSYKIMLTLLKQLCFLLAAVASGHIACTLPHLQAHVARLCKDVAGENGPDYQDIDSWAPGFKQAVAATVFLCPRDLITLQGIAEFLGTNACGMASLQKIVCKQVRDQLLTADKYARVMQALQHMSLDDLQVLRRQLVFITADGVQICLVQATRNSVVEARNLAIEEANRLGLGMERTPSTGACLAHARMHA